MNNHHDEPATPALHWWARRAPSVVRVDGPYRVTDDQTAHDELPKARPVGFTANLDDEPAVEPDLWEGDNA